MKTTVRRSEMNRSQQQIKMDVKEYKNKHKYPWYEISKDGPKNTESPTATNEENSLAEIIIPQH